MSRLLAVACALALFAPEARGETLDDGMQLIVLPCAATTVSLRYVVKTGASDDPKGMPGLAHLLEHAIFQGSRELGELDLQDTMRSAGAHINARTSARSTVFTLEAPRAIFPELAKKFLRVITNPRLETVKLEREAAVILGEEDLSPSGATLLDLVEQAIFSANDSERPILGTRRSRASFDLKSLIDFYQQHYQPANTVLIVAGDLNAEFVKTLLEKEKAILLPPSLAKERPAQRTPTIPSLPFETKMRARFMLAVQGYRVDSQDKESCEQLAELAQLRLALALQIREPLARSVEVLCGDLAGNEFLFAFAFGSGVFGSRVPEVMGETMEALATRAPRRDELEAIGQRLERSSSARLADPVALAEAAVQEVTSTVTTTSASALGLKRALLSSENLSRVIKRTIKDDRRIQLSMSPFDG